MSRQEYLKLLEREIHNINKKIDYKILRGETYFKEARDHRLLLRKVRENTGRRTFLDLFGRLLPSVFQFR